MSTKIKEIRLSRLKITLSGDVPYGVEMKREVQRDEVEKLLSALGIELSELEDQERINDEFLDDVASALNTYIQGECSFCTITNLIYDDFIYDSFMDRFEPSLAEYATFIGKLISLSII